MPGTSGLARPAALSAFGPKRTVAGRLVLWFSLPFCVDVGARRGKRDPAGAHGGAVWRWTRRLPCGVGSGITSASRNCEPRRNVRCHGRGASHNSLRALRALRSDRCDENVDEARCARRPCRCAPRRPTNRPRRVPPAAPLGLWYSLFWARAGQPSRGIRSAVRSAQRHKGGARRAEDSRGAECAVGLVPHQATGIRAVMISGTTKNVRNGPKAVVARARPGRAPRQ